MLRSVSASWALFGMLMIIQGDNILASPQWAAHLLAKVRISLTDLILILFQ